MTKLILIEFLIHNFCNFINKKADIRIIESIQRRATKLVPHIMNRTYAERLEHLGLTTLEERRTKGDLISYFKIKNGLNTVNWLLPSSTASSLNCVCPANSIRGHNQRIRAQVTNCDARFNFIPNRVVNVWNNLGQNTLDARSVNSFKTRLDKENRNKKWTGKYNQN